jgi:dTDP-4-amino-4,6-dideoxygalactose transaminase
VSVFNSFAANFSAKQTFRHLFSCGNNKHSADLISALKKRYSASDVALYSNGRSALAAAIKATVPAGSKIAINGLTCYAVIQAVRAADCEPVYIDISPVDLNLSASRLDQVLRKITDIKAVIVQNTLGYTTNIKSIEKIAKNYSLVIIEDLAHCAGARYTDGREVGTVGAAAALSFGKGKAIDTVSGGAVVISQNNQSAGQNAALSRADFLNPARRPKTSDNLRARFYTFFGLLIRSLYSLKIGKLLASLLFKIHFIKRSADGRVDFKTKLPNWQAKLALTQLKHLNQTAKSRVKTAQQIAKSLNILHLSAPVFDAPLRVPVIVKNREALLKKLNKSGFHLDDIWYDVPVSPRRYYAKVNFPEKDCLETVQISQDIINLPTFYPLDKLTPAIDIIKEFL